MIGGIFETMARLMMRERFIQMFKKEVGDGGVIEIEVFLNKETEYVVRSRVSKGHGTPTLSVLDGAGIAVPVHRSAKGRRISLIPERDGLYNLRVDAGLGTTVTVTLSRYDYALPTYYMQEIESSSYGLFRPAAKKNRFAEMAPQSGATTKTERENSEGMVCLQMSEYGKGD